VAPRGPGPAWRGLLRCAGIEPLAIFRLLRLDRVMTGIDPA
jgi:hypothetical protein